MSGLPPPSQNDNARLHDNAQLKDILSNGNESRKELQAPLPIKSSSVENSISENTSCHPAALRHRHRRAIQSTIPKQLEVEIHNEGLWIAPTNEKTEEMKRNEVKGNDDAKTQEAEFVPWSLKARDILLTIVCGEIPIGYGPDRFDFGDALAVQGGCIRCVVTDLRTGETTASRQRAECTKLQEEEGILEIEKNVVQLNALMAEADKNVQKADVQEKEFLVSMEKCTKEVAKAKKLLVDFRTKFGRFFGPGKGTHDAYGSRHSRASH